MKRSRRWYGLLVVAATMLMFGALGQTDIKTIIIDATEDAYVVTDIADVEDEQGFREKNYGDLEFLKTWYAWGVVGDERLVSIDLVKFNLAELKGKEVESAMLQLYARTANLREPARLVDVHRVREAWSEDDVTFNSRPSWDPAPIATPAIYGAGGWYSWNITGSVIEAVRSGEVSVAVALRSVAEESEEQVVFVSTEGLSKMPRLMVTVQATPTDIPIWIWFVIGALVIVILSVGFMAVRRPWNRAKA